MCRVWRAEGIDVGVTILFPQPSDLRGAFEETGVALRFLDLPATLFARWAALARALYGLRRSYPSAAVISMPFGWHAFAFLGARLAGPGATLVHIGNYPTPDGGMRWIVFQGLVLLGRYFTRAYVCCSSHVACGVRRVFGLHGSKVYVVPNGVVVMPLPAQRAAPQGILRIGMVATLEAHKDHATLLKAIPLLEERLIPLGLKLQLGLAGSGTLEANLRALAEELGIATRVAFLGTVQDIPAFLESLDVFVFSTTEAEGQGIALLEAMAAGVPIVASDVGACREVLDGGRAGRLFAPRDPGALVDAVLAVLAKPHDTQARRSAAHTIVERDFNVVRTAQIYAELAGTRP